MQHDNFGRSDVFNLKIGQVWSQLYFALTDFWWRLNRVKGHILKFII